MSSLGMNYVTALTSNIPVANGQIPVVAIQGLGSKLLRRHKGFTAIAQKINLKMVPAPVKASFAKAYPAVKTIKWEKENGDFEAGFKQGSKEMSAVFKADGMQTESELEISAANLPATVVAYVKHN